MKSSPPYEGVELDLIGWTHIVELGRNEASTYLKRLIIATISAAILASGCSD